MLILKYVQRRYNKTCSLHVVRAILLSTMIKYQVNILYIFLCVFLYKSVNASHSVQFLTFRKQDHFFNLLLCTISIWKALCNRPKVESKTY